MSLLERARDQSSRYVRVEREDIRVVAIGTIDGTRGAGWEGFSPACEEEVQSALVCDESSKDIVLNEMEQVIGRKRKDDRRRCEVSLTMALWRFVVISSLVYKRSCWCYKFGAGRPMAGYFVLCVTKLVQSPARDFECMRFLRVVRALVLRSQAVCSLVMPVLGPSALFADLGINCILFGHSRYRPGSSMNPKFC